MKPIGLLRHLFYGILFLINGCYVSYHPPTKLESLSDTDYNWQHDSTMHFDFYYELNSSSAEYVDSAKVYFEIMLPGLLDFLGIPSYENKLNLFMVESRQRMKKIVGIETNGIAKVNDNTVYSIFNKEIKTFGKHEFCHVLCFNIWGNYKEAWVSEGLAVAADNKWWGYDLYCLSNYLKTKNKLVPIKEIIENFRKYDSFITYPECGSFVKYLKEKYGISMIEQLWTGGVKAIEDAFKLKIESIEDEWIEEIKKHEQRNINYEENIFAMFGQRL